ncbi:L,D-transpeptidase [Lacinutrix sp. Bg11-31]|uniref:L,D-transpeptidase n=1 Tax=Lacinutrix sp. Bg11-31 TaxID=2057808 RepID=UPI000C30DDBA|nr:L,D-transpeptidase [Lacinutrix sp. Bg11-31]AUC81136.1 L,D-transpeptidase [Lacinutrix sp. Bg11-31]
MCKKKIFLLFILSLLFIACNTKEESIILSSQVVLIPKISVKKDSITTILIEKPVKIEHYFQYLDSIVCKYDSITPYSLTEHLLVRANPWIIDTLQNTDYYRLKAKDSFVYNQKKMVILPKGANLILPDSVLAKKLQKSIDKTLIDVNIPEYKLRIYEDSLLLYEFTVRVGRHEKKYLKFGDRITDLRTKTGNGSIVDHVKNPDYYNPVNGHQYHVTRRDDNKVTALPQIPWLITEINNIRYGQLIHPTTNPKSLGKAYSNGCIGTREADAWIIYYHATLGTKINIRYDLMVEKDGKPQVLKDIYGLNKKKL